MTFLQLGKKSRAAVCLGALVVGTLHCSSEPANDSGDQAATAALECPECAKDFAPPELTYDELVQIGSSDGHRSSGAYVVDKLDDGAVLDKLHTLLGKARISNEAFRRGALPKKPSLDGHPESDAMHKLGSTMRVSAWNLERGIRFSQVESLFKAAASDPSQYLAGNDALAPTTDDQAQTLARQLRELGETNILVLNEVDVGLARSEYADEVARIAAAMNMNYAFAPQFVEANDLNLGLSSPKNAYTVDTSKVRALNGNAVLSRYPIVQAEVLDLEAADSSCWDWSKGKENVVKEFFDKLAATVDNNLDFPTFFDWTVRERRHGGRSALLVDVRVPGLDVGPEKNVVTVVAAELETRSSPGCRRAQLQRIRDRIATLRHPVVMAGDFSTTGGDSRPVTIERFFLNRLGNWEWYVKEFLPRITPIAGTVFTVSDALNELRTAQDPTGFSLPLLLPNPEKKLFDTIEKMRFADGAHFDFRGDEDRTFNRKKKTLANSNQRDVKGFRATAYLGPTDGALGPLASFSGLVRRFDFLDNMKVDWIFVRGYANDARKKGPYRMAPHFPEVYEELRNVSSHMLSRHAALSVVLPLQEPGTAVDVDTPVPPDADDYGACYVAPDDTSQCTDDG